MSLSGPHGQIAMRIIWGLRSKWAAGPNCPKLPFYLVLNTFWGGASYFGGGGSWSRAQLRAHFGHFRPFRPFRNITSDSAKTP